MTRTTIIALALLLGGCTNQGFNPIVVEAVGILNPFDEAETEEVAAGQPVTRAAIERADIATIRARLVDDKSPTYLFAASDNGGYVTFASNLRQTLTLRGSQITGSRGLGYDLLSATSSQPDPLSRPIRPGSWPDQVVRSYEFPADSPRGRVESFDCRFEAGPIRDVVMLQKSHRVVEISEYCDGPTGAFENLHLADVSDGTVWRSLQWLGPQQGLIDLEMVLPYTGD